jgi:hypothetical protein
MPVVPPKLPLCPRDLEDLRSSGLTDATIRANALRTEWSPVALATILGRLPDRPKKQIPEFCRAGGLVFPYRDLDGNVNCYGRVKPRCPRVRDGSPVKYEQPAGVPPRAYYPVASLPGLRDGTSPVFISEGEKKALALSQLGLAAVGLGGVWCWKTKGSEGLIDDLATFPWAGRVVYVAFDYDPKPETRKHVALAAKRLRKALREAGAQVVYLVELPPGPDGAKCGVDDFLLANGPEAFAALVEAARQKYAGRTQITVSTEEHLVNEAAVNALANEAGVFQRGGLLVRVVSDRSPAAEGRGIRRPFTPRIEVLPAPILRERLAANAVWLDQDGNLAHPPGWCVSAVGVRGEWPGVRHLEAIVDYPVLRPDGSILSDPGYDAATGLLLVPGGGLSVDVPEAPTRDDAVAARDELLKIIVDFPFASPVGRSAWLASLLTPLARFAFPGPPPLFLVDGNTAGVGKGLLLHCTSTVVTGDRLTIATYTQDEDELRKRITSLAVAGDRLVLFDNLAGRFGSATLDAALTGTVWEDRILGSNRMARVPLYTTWFATGNNVNMAGDTPRRVCHIRLESELERPEERRGFRHPDLLAYVKGQRPRLLAAALLILHAYCVAGRPDMKLSPWGSFEGWTALVRSAVAWVGMEDPGEARLSLQSAADEKLEALRLLMDCWEKMDADRRGLTAATVMYRLDKEPWREPVNDRYYADMRSAVETLVGKADSRLLGYYLRTYRRRILDGRFFDHAGEEHRTIRWSVYAAEQFSAGGRAHHSSPSSPPAGSSPGGDGGDNFPPPKDDTNQTGGDDGLGGDIYPSSKKDSQPEGPSPDCPISSGRETSPLTPSSPPISSGPDSEDGKTSPPSPPPGSSGGGDDGLGGHVSSPPKNASQQEGGEHPPGMSQLAKNLRALFPDAGKTSPPSPPSPPRG